MLITNQRVNTIALVAPGGIGKTALALDLLNNLVSSPIYSKYVDVVLFTTMKTEKLTANGVISLDSIETISELKNSILLSINNVFDESYDSFDFAVNAHQSDKVLLCLDNLETLLRDNPDSFDELNQSLPANWKVLVTSRVAISNATILSLDGLKKKSAVHLARTYVTKRGGSPLALDSYATLSKDCHFNPLAIRLTLDLLLTGKALPDSINVANREIAEFSYNNLIEVLDNKSIEVLEAIFVDDNSSRLSLCEILGMSLDEISPAIGELTRTSLISRNSSEDGEFYSLSTSVKELLVISPRNISIRNSVQEKINKRRLLSKEIDITQNEKEIKSWHVAFIPSDTTESLKIIVKEVNSKLMRSRSSTNLSVDLYRRLREMTFIYEGSFLFHRTIARVLETLKDMNSAEGHYKQALALNPLDVASSYLLAQLYQYTKKHDQAYLIYNELVERGIVNHNSPDQLQLSENIYNGYFSNQIFLGRYEDVLEQTKEWKTSPYRRSFGTYRASAWKRKMENIVESDPKAVVEALNSASQILSDIFTNDGYFNRACFIAKKVLEEVEYCFSRYEYAKKFSIEGLKLLNLFDKYLLEIIEGDKKFDYELIKQLSNINIQGNPFQSGKWTRMFNNESDFDCSDLETQNIDGLLTVRIHHRPKERASFLFAKCSENQDYFLHFDKFISNNWKDWCKLSIGQQIRILPDSNPALKNKAICANEIHLI
ncbi:tetratricopeptide repeat protein [Photobacterium profundum]|uniref:Uncharacterized protein n=1 Tax=Photobacterium profundum (strain SS9) TaxID=298386 RepID=Q6LHQ1_PHOPR|nr:hypothetical protein [Photobacterium profundum]CAG23179.1 hypothetical protein PBPRB1308 [Photobacterium profundum SS9]